jgi:hypothetical protein
VRYTVHTDLYGKAATSTQLYAGASGLLLPDQGGMGAVDCLPPSLLLLLFYPSPNRRDV